MSRKLTSYKQPSIADPIAGGKGTAEQLQTILDKLIKDGAASSTIKRVKRAIVARSSSQ